MIALIDGEHYPPVVRSALRALEEDYGYEVIGTVFVGGLEKISEESELELGYPLVMNHEQIKGILEAIERFNPDLVIDLSDEPVVDYEKRLRFASHVLKHGVGYVGSDFRFEPPAFEEILIKPSMAVIGTGKRVGKTAISGYICRELDRAGFNPCVVAMGRGGPPEPEVLLGREIELTPQKLLDLAWQGKHAASDYFEDALTSRITTIGCRRCGGGLAGAPFISNVGDGARLANELDVDFVVMEGSGATLPPVVVDRYVLTVGAGQPIEYIVGYFGTYRILLSDLVVIAMAEPPIADLAKVREIDKGIRSINPAVKVAHTIFRPKPLGSIEGKRIFVTTTAPASVKNVIGSHLADKYGAEVVGISNKLSNRRLLRKEIESVAGKVTTLVTELKAAAVDLTTDLGLDMGLEVIYLDNEPVTVGGDGELGELVLGLAKEAHSSSEG